MAITNVNTFNSYRARSLMSPKFEKNLWPFFESSQLNLLSRQKTGWTGCVCNLEEELNFVWTEVIVQASNLFHKLPHDYLIILLIVQIILIWVKRRWSVVSCLDSIQIYKWFGQYRVQYNLNSAKLSWLPMTSYNFGGFPLLLPTDMASKFRDHVISVRKKLPVQLLVLGYFPMRYAQPKNGNISRVIVVISQSSSFRSELKLHPAKRNCF